jgi:hypothetical protein
MVPIFGGDGLRSGRRCLGGRKVSAAFYPRSKGFDFFRGKFARRRHLDTIRIQNRAIETAMSVSFFVITPV